MMPHEAVGVPVWRVDDLGVPVCLDAEDARTGFTADAEGTPRVWAKVDKATGFLHGEARIARTGVQVYSDGRETWGELRDASEVFAQDAVASFARLVVTDDHPPKFVTADTARDLQVGHLGDALRRDGRWLVAPFTITDAATIAKIRKGKAEVSAGYWSRTVPAQGTEDGDAYAYKQTAIRGNHLAIVDRARAGREARIPNFDGDEAPKEKTEMQNEDKAPAAEDTPKAPQPGKPTADAATLARLDALEAENARLRADLDQAKASENARIDARVGLVSTAKALVPGFDHRGKSDAEIRRAVVVAIAPDLEAKIDARADVPGYLEAAFDLAVDRHHAEGETVAKEFASVTRTAEGEADPKADAHPLFIETREAVAGFFGTADK